MDLGTNISLYAVSVRTSNWAELVEWYRHGLGMRVAFRVVDDSYALLLAGGGRLALIGDEHPGEASKRFSLAFEVESLEAAVARLDAVGADHSGPQDNPEGFREVTTVDPDGNRIRLFCWN